MVIRCHFKMPVKIQLGQNVSGLPNWKFRFSMREISTNYLSQMSRTHSNWWCVRFMQFVYFMRYRNCAECHNSESTLEICSLKKINRNVLPSKWRSDRPIYQIAICQILQISRDFADCALSNWKWAEKHAESKSKEYSKTI